MKKIYFAIALLVLAIIVLAIFANRHSVSDIKDTASISGALGYPSELSPEQTVCAEDKEHNEIACTELADLTFKVQTCGLSDWQAHKGEVIQGEMDCEVGVQSYNGYTLYLPAGSYYIYSKLLNPPPGLKNSKAYYSEYVKCGMNAQCSSHTPILVEVSDGQTLQKIDPTDWYVM